MAAFSKLLLSGSTNGKQIKLTPTTTPGTTIHTAVSGTSSLDEIWLWANNEHTADVVLTIEYGGVTVVDNTITMTIPTKGGLVLIVPGLLLQNSLIVKAYAATTNVITISGFVNRIV